MVSHSHEHQGLYIRTRVGAVGPYTLDALRRMVRAGILPAEGAVSTDKVHWRRADTLGGLFPDQARPAAPRAEQVRQPRERTEGLQTGPRLRELIDRLCGHRVARWLFSTPVLLAVLCLVPAAIFAGGAHALGLQEAFTWKRLWILLALGLPSVLAALAMLVVGGNALIRLVLGLSEAERRFLALHLPASAAEKLRWGRFLLNWLYRGDWLFRPVCESPPAYIHLFRDGEPLADIEEEVGLWRRLAAQLPYGMRPLCEPGHALRQVQQVQKLPSWTAALEDLTDGYALAGLLDQNYSQWAEGFIARARRRLGLRSTAPVDFLLAHLDDAAGRRLLAVCVYPRRHEPALQTESPSGSAAA
jgi:hypothetical protein